MDYNREPKNLLPARTERPRRAAFELVSRTNRIVLAPGGYLDSQTSDTQFFSDAEHDSQQPPFQNPLVDDENSSIPGTSAFNVPNFISPSSTEDRPGSPDRRSSGSLDKWVALDGILNGPGYGDGRPWTKFPILASRRFGQERPDIALRWAALQASDEEALLVSDFFHGYRTLAHTLKPNNVVQGESIYLTLFIVRLLPFMSRAVMDSNITRQRQLLQDFRKILGAIEMLIDVEEEAREHINDVIDEELEGMEEPLSM
ncbi:hypothetical protein HWV62_22012 [Athelia sp. TMB]|nr:hypothetical protein HWV62_26170 [Athelia sp. TMB]KAF7971132.1 hypothetical protein HWV62_22012 [Athelia sp. TMB]